MPSVPWTWGHSWAAGPDPVAATGSPAASRRNARASSCSTSSRRLSTSRNEVINEDGRMCQLRIDTDVRTPSQNSLRELFVRRLHRRPSAAE